MRNAVTFQSIDTLNENTDSGATMAQLAEHATAAQKVPRSNRGHSFLFGENLGTYVSSEGIGKKLKTVL